MTESVEIFIEGRPIAQPRHRQAVRGKDRKTGRWIITNYIPADHAVHAWKFGVRKAVGQMMINADMFQFEDAISVDLVFVHPRPKSRQRKTNNRYWHSSKPDVDNMAKAVLDALNECAWLDDCLICKSQIFDYVAGDGDRSGVAIRIKKLAADFNSWADSLIRVGQSTKSIFEDHTNE